jgi:transcriptional regulator with XRE-family HTH domain
VERFVPSPVRAKENVAFGDTVKMLRLRKGLDQADLAERCGYKRWWAVKIETHRRKISLLDIRLLAAGLEMKEDVLFRKYMAWRDAR